MSGPYVEQTAEPGEAAKGVELVTEEIEDRFWEAAAPGPLAAGDGIGSGEVRRGLIAVAAALVAAAEERGAAKERERLLRIYHREPMSQDCRDGSHFGGCTGCRCICHGPNGTRGGWNS